MKTFEELFGELRVKAEERPEDSGTVRELDSGIHFIGKKILEEAGLKVEVNKRLGGPFGTVRSTDPAPGSSVKPDSKVTINIF